MRHQVSYGTWKYHDNNPKPSSMPGVDWAIVVGLIVGLIYLTVM